MGPKDSMIRAAMTPAKQLHVGIVGAGFSGLRCADVLLQHGHRVTIFEGRERIGGRVAQSDHLGKKVDLGPNWIHGTDDNPILDIARQTGTCLHSWDGNTHLYDEHGSDISPEEALEYGQLMWDDLISGAFKHSNVNKETISPQESLFDFFRDRVKHLFTDSDAEEARRKRSTLLNLTKMWGYYVGSPVERQSLKFYWLEEMIEGENPFVAETYDKISRAVSKTALEHGEVKLGTKAITITGVVNSGSDVNEQPSVTTDDGSTQSFDEVVVTAPLGWLKRNKGAFQPALETRLSQAIDNIGYGSLDKVLFTFPTAFWRTDRLAPSVRLDPTSKTPNAAAASASVHKIAAEDRSGNGNAPKASLVHWLSPEYDPRQNPESWNQEALDLAVLPDDLGHATLLFYTQGPCSQHIASLVRDTPRDDLDAALTAWFEPYISRLPGYSADDASCRPTAVLATAWANDELAGYGSYSNFQVGLERGDEDIGVMRRGMPERGVWFAGEHTAPFIALGTTTGAYMSGQAVAERIMAKHEEKAL